MKGLMLTGSMFPGFRGRPKTNGMSGAPIAMAMDECLLHEGCCYRAFVEKTGMAKDDVLYICFKTPASKYRIQISEVNWGTLGAGEFVMIENATWTGNTGTTIGVIQRERGMPENSELLEDSTGSFQKSNKLLIDPSGVSGGKIINTDSTIIKKSAEPICLENKELLAEDTTYVFKIIATASGNVAKLKILWSEVRIK